MSNHALHSTRNSRASHGDSLRRVKRGRGSFLLSLLVAGATARAKSCPPGDYFSPGLVTKGSAALNAVA